MIGGFEVTVPWWQAAVAAVARRALVAIVSATLLAAIGFDPGQAQAQLPPDCARYAPNSPRACSVQPLDAPLLVPAPAPVPTPSDKTIRPPVPGEKTVTPVKPKPVKPKPPVIVIPVEKLAHAPIGTIIVYRLTKDDLKALDKLAERAGEARGSVKTKAAADAEAGALADAAASAAADAAAAAAANDTANAVAARANAEAASADTVAARATAEAANMNAVAARATAAAARAQSADKAAAKSAALVAADAKANAVAARARAETARADAAAARAKAVTALAAAAEQAAANAAAKSVAARANAAAKAAASAAATAKADTAATDAATAGARGGTLSMPASTAVRSPTWPCPPISQQLQSVQDVEFPTERVFRRTARNLLCSASAETIDAVTRQAAKHEKYSALKESLKWQATPGSAVVRPLPAWGYRTIYGFMPFWWGVKPPAAKSPPQIDFSLFDRIGVVGVQIDPKNGRWAPEIANAPAAEDRRVLSMFARRAQEHGTALDLVLEGSNWSDLPVLPATATNDVVSPEYISKFNEIGDIAQRAANAAMVLVNLPMTDNERYLRWLLWPIWNSPDHIFGGITVMFTPPPSGSPEEPGFRIFADQFTRALITGMQGGGRALTLNIATDSTHFCRLSSNAARSDASAQPCKPGAFSISNLDIYGTAIKTGQPLAPAALSADAAVNRPPSKKPPADAAAANSFLDYVRSSIASWLRPAANGGIKLGNFNVLVFFPIPKRNDVLQLRATIDSISSNAKSGAFEVGEKVDLARSFVPIIVGPGAETAAADDSALSKLRTELSYYNEVFGGVGFWPVPAANSEAGKQVQKAINDTVFALPLSLGKNVPYDGSIDPFYTSLTLRLFWQLTVIGVIFFAVSYVVAVVSDSKRKIIAGVTFLLAVLAVAIFFFLLRYDPALYSTRQGNGPLAVLVVVVLATIFVGIRRPVIRDP